MYPILCRIGPISVHAYGFMLAVAFLVGVLITLHYAKREKIDADVILELAMYGMIAAIVGSRLLYVIGEWEQYKDNILEIFMVQKGGLAFLGGLILGILVVAWRAKRRGVPPLKFMDVAVPGTALGYAVARVGCFLNGCCFGLPTEVPWAMHFPFGSLAHSQFPADTIHPTQVYAMLSMFAVFLIVVYLWKHKKYDGQIFFWWLILYSVYRFIVEFFRYCPEELYFWGLNPGQIIALAMFAAGAVFVIYNRKRSRQ